jgi:hypothetical protein
MPCADPGEPPAVVSELHAPPAAFFTRTVVFPLVRLTESSVSSMRGCRSGERCTPYSGSLVRPPLKWTTRTWMTSFIGESKVRVRSGRLRVSFRLVSALHGA